MRTRVPEEDNSDSMQNCEKRQIVSEYIPVRR